MAAIAQDYLSALTVLVLDDESSVRRLVRRMLESHGCRVLEAEDGESGLALLQSLDDDPDLVLTDLAMPNISGVAVYEALSRHNRAIPVLGMSGGVLRQAPVGDGDRRRLEILRKPFDSEKLLVAIRDAIARCHPVQRRAERARVRSTDHQDDKASARGSSATLVESAREVQHRLEMDGTGRRTGSR